MTYLSTHKANRVQRVDKFELAYSFTLKNLCRSEAAIPTNAPLQILHLLLECPRDHTSHALELWLFCEARKIFNNIERTRLRQKAIHQQIVQRFVMQLAPEKRSDKTLYIQQLIRNILEKMGFRSWGVGEFGELSYVA